MLPEELSIPLELFSFLQDGFAEHTAVFTRAYVNSCRSHRFPRPAGSKIASPDPALFARSRNAMQQDPTVSLHRIAYE